MRRRTASKTEDRLTHRDNEVIEGSMFQKLQKQRLMGLLIWVDKQEVAP